jgi:hypothetical protein
MIRLCDVNNKSAQSKPLPEYAPVSVKDEMNKPTYNALDCRSNSQLFLSDRNIYGMNQYVVKLNIDNMTRANPDKLKKLVPVRMIKWAEKTNINDYEDIFNDTMATLRYLNEKFLTDNGDLYDIDGCHALNVFQNMGRVTDKCGKPSIKKYDEMLATDYHTIDLWRPQTTTQENNKFRYDNAIPMWQKSMNRRHYSRANDGLHDAIPERASLDTQLRGYDMSNIKKGAEYYENHFYENL